ncbi:MAG: hypothetical protein ACK5O2_08950 [Microthrixaceae bacterium]
MENDMSRLSMIGTTSSGTLIVLFGMYELSVHAQDRDYRHRLVDLNFELMAVESEEEGERLPKDPLVGVGQRVIASDAHDEDISLLGQRR